MNINLNLEKRYTLTLKDLVFIILLSVLAGAVLLAFVPVLVYTIALGFIIYMALTIYYRVKGSAADGP